MKSRPSDDLFLATADDDVSVLFSVEGDVLDDVLRVCLTFKSPILSTKWKDDAKGFGEGPDRDADEEGVFGGNANVESVLRVLLFSVVVYWTSENGGHLCIYRFFK